MTLLEKEKIARRTLIWVLVYSIPAFQAMLPVEDPDLWWHLRTGQWIIEHGRVPMVDSFSAYGMGKPWVAYSWLFEVIISGIHTRFGLVGIVLFTAIMSLLIAIVLHLLVRRVKLPFTAEMILMALALGSMKPVVSPRSWLFTILFFAVELLVLLNVRRSGRINLLWVLAPLFAVWANLHIQFIYGLAAMAFFLVEVILSRICNPNLGTGASATLSLARLCGVATACVLAIFLTPYHYRLLQPVFEISAQAGVFSNVAELHPLFFRSPADWFILALTIAAVYVLGWERKWLPFPTLLLALGAVLGFRARRDAWVVVLAATVIISQYQKLMTSDDFFRLTKLRILGIAAAVTLAIYFIGQYRQISNPHLGSHVESHFPAAAVSFIIDHRYPGPLYNHFDWGGYLIWKLPGLPVSMDGRGNVHGDQRIERSLATWSGRAGWESDPELMNARLVVAEVWRPLTSLLRNDPCFRLVYEDSIAAVFIATGRPAGQSQAGARQCVEAGEAIAK